MRNALKNLWRWNNEHDFIVAFYLGVFAVMGLDCILAEWFW